jgi:hypothetical protein
VLDGTFFVQSALAQETVEFTRRGGLQDSAQAGGFANLTAAVRISLHTSSDRSPLKPLSVESPTGSWAIILSALRASIVAHPKCDTPTPPSLRRGHTLRCARPQKPVGRAVVCEGGLG